MKNCLSCGIAFQGDGDECSDCIMAELEERAEAERRAGLECERETLRDELQRYGHKMTYTVLRLKIRRIWEICEILSPQNEQP